MAKKGKRYKKVAEKVQVDNFYELKDACKIVVETASAKFDESVDVAIHLGVDPKKADQNLRGSVALPNGLGKTIRVAVMAKGEKAEEAKSAGADIVGVEDLVAMIQAGNLDFDSLIATPDMMVQVGKVGKILGPRGLMPSPKIGTVTLNVGEAVKRIKAGVAEYKVNKDGAVQVSVGKASFGAQKIQENIEALISALNRAKPQSSKGVYFKSMAMATTMGPGVRLNVAPLRQ